MHRQTSLLLVAAIALAGCSTTTVVSDRSDRAARELDRALAGRVAGEPVNCIDGDDASNNQIIDSRTILYRRVGRTIWVNNLEESCPSLAPNETLLVERFGSQLCRNDRIRVISPGVGIPGPMCRLGKFVPYRKP